MKIEWTFWTKWSNSPNGALSKQHIKNNSNYWNLKVRLFFKFINSAWITLELFSAVSWTFIFVYVPFCWKQQQLKQQQLLWTNYIKVKAKEKRKELLKEMFVVQQRVRVWVQQESAKYWMLAQCNAMTGCLQECVRWRWWQWQWRWRWANDDKVT